MMASSAPSMSTVDKYVFAQSATSAGISSSSADISSSHRSFFKCVSFMRHSIAAHNEAAAISPDAMSSVYLSETYADSSLSARGYELVAAARERMLGLTPAPDVVLCSPLTRAIQTAIAMFQGTGTRIVAMPDVREAYGQFPCDRHRDKKELLHMCGDSVDFSLCDDADKVWTRDHREEMSHLNHRVASFVESVLRRTEGHVFVVSHGVFMESAVRYLTNNFSDKTRVHNCEVHSFVFSLPLPPPPLLPNSSSTSSSNNNNNNSSSNNTNSSLLTPTSPALTTTTTSPSATLTAATSMKAAATARSGEKQIDDKVNIASATPNEHLTTTTATPTIHAKEGSGNPRSGVIIAGGIGLQRPRVDAYLTGQELALACASGVPLQSVAHINRVFRHFSAGGRGQFQGVMAGLNQGQFVALMARCRLSAQEASWVFSALDRERAGTVAPEDFLHAIMAFYSKDLGAGAATAAIEDERIDSRAAGLMELQKQYQAAMRGTPLANYEVLKRAFNHIASTLLAIQYS